jgi:uncharacterized protein YfaQ (DUF2300 family)
MLDINECHRKFSGYYHSMSLTVNAYLQQVGTRATVSNCHATIQPQQDCTKRPETLHRLLFDLQTSGCH